MVWAFFASAIVAIWVFSWQAKLKEAAWMIAVVGVEVFVLVVNHWQCPLTPLAEGFSPQTHSNEPLPANFDIYLPEWLARCNKLLFGFLYGAGVVYATYTWLFEGSNYAR